MHNPPPRIRLVHIRLYRGATQILTDISWTVRPGEHWVILGANGSGKTSLLSALTGYLTPSAGTIELLGQRYGRSNWPELRKRVGLVSSSIRQMMNDSEPALSAVVSGKYAMIDCWRRPSAVDRQEARRILRRLECAALEERPWLFLSQGERQRVLIGRALMAKPDILILDEPCAGLDPAAREHFLHFLQRLGTGPRAPTLILVTHHVEEIMPVFSHVLILKEGTILAQGGKRSVLTSRWLAAAMNAGVTLTANSRGRYTMAIRPQRRRIV